MKVLTLGVDVRREDLHRLPLPFVLVIQTPSEPILPTWIPAALEKIRRGADLVRANRLDPATHVVLRPVDVHREARRLRQRRRWMAWRAAVRGVVVADYGSGHFAIRGAAIQALLPMLPNRASESRWRTDLQILACREKLVIEEVPCRIETHRRTALSEHTLTADDWGLSPAVNQGILELCKQRVLRRVSVLADGKYLSDGLADLLSIPGVQLSFHFNLTHETRHRSPLRLWFATSIGRLKASEVRREFLRQLQILRRNGIHPELFDGHHHCHVFPGVLEALLPLLKDAGIRQVRLPLDPTSWAPARILINLFAIRSAQRLQATGLRTQPFYYPVAAVLRDPTRLRHELAHRPPSEVLVHPALRDDFEELGIADPYRSQRVEEFRALERLGVNTETNF